MKTLIKIIKGLTKVELAFSGITFALMVVCYFISVVNRNIIKSSMPWTEELALYGMVYMALIGTEIGLRDGTQVCVTALTDKVKGTTAGKILYLISHVILIIFLFIMFRYGIALVVRQFQTGQTSPVMKIPMYVLYLSLPISFGISVFIQTLLLVGKIAGWDLTEITNVDAIADSFISRKEKKA